MKKGSLFFAIALASGSASAAQLWVAPAAQKIRPGLLPAPDAPTTAQLSAAQNEFESFQVVITGAATGVSMSLEGLSDGVGHTIVGRDVVLYREALIDVPAPTGGDGAAGWWPDALIPSVDPIVGEKRNAFPFDVPAGESRAVLVDVHVPQDAPAGLYRGVLNVTGGVAAQVPVELTVWDFAIPSTSTLKSAFGLDWNAPCMGHGSGDCMDDYAAEMQLRARYVQAALDNHISIYAPFWTETVSTTGSADWSDFDLYVGPLLDGTAGTRLRGAKLTAVDVNQGWSAPMVAGWGQHFRQKGWSTTVFSYICDEPPQTCAWTDVNPRIAASHTGDPSIPTLVTTTSTEAAQNGIVGLDLIVPVIDHLEGKPGTTWAGNHRASYPASTWWYQSCDSFGCTAGSNVTGWPTYAIDSDATRNRAMEWMSFTYDMQGELYYETAMAYYQGDPWLSQTAFGGTGDGTLFYPGTVAKIGGQTEIPIESLRMKMIRDGMEDYELLSLAASLGLHDQAMSIALSVFPVTYQATSTPATLDAARAELAGLILHALGRDTPPADGGTGSSDAGTAADAGDAGSSAGSAPADSGSAPADAGTSSTAADSGTAVANSQGAAPAVTTAGVAGGCSSSGAEPALLGLAALAFAVWNRRRATAR